MQKRKPFSGKPLTWKMWTLDGRYDVMLDPRTQDNNAVIMEFKVQEEDEKALSDTVEDALRQIEERNYKASLAARGIPEERIRMYGFAFCGKKVLIGRK